jgi:hypothetical protein
MDVEFECYELPLKNVNEFKYLGLIISREKNNPSTMLLNRISKTESAFNSIKCHTILFGLFNRRVRV